MSSEIKVDTISEQTSANGVAIDSVTLKDGGVTATAASTITVADNSDNLTLTSTDADANAGPNLRLYRNSSSPADHDIVGQIDFEGRNDNSEDIVYAKMYGSPKDVSDGTEDGGFFLNTILAGSDVNRMGMSSSQTVFNDDSNDIDFRVETNGNAHGLFVDGGNDLVMIGGTGSGSGSTDHRIVLFDFGQINIFRQNANSDVFAVIFNNADSGSAIGSIRMNGSATTFNTSSDYRLKENVNYDWDATTRLKQLKPARFNWIADDTNTALEGFLAHEVTNVVPEAISGDKDQVATSEDVTAGLAGAVGDPIYQGIDQSKLVPLMVKTIQELEARIKALEDNQ
jgi:hypothetical protein